MNSYHFVIFSKSTLYGNITLPRFAEFVVVPHELVLVVGNLQLFNVLQLQSGTGPALLDPEG
jgi:hypothetical protein